MRRLSLALKSRSSTSAVAKPDPLKLGDFLTKTKVQYLEDVQNNEGGQWTVVMGNEAGDLDTMASSIAYSWIEATVKKKRAVAYMQVGREDLRLRNENIYAMNLAGLKDEGPELVFSNDLPSATKFPSDKFELVDHNRLGQAFRAENPNAQVFAVIDHHDDEGLYKDTADPRTIAPAGSCSSHVARLCPPDVPAELATLLLCAILIDTGGLKPGGKALQVDYEAVAFLLPKSTLGPAISEQLRTQLADNPPQSLAESLYETKSIKDLTSELANRKENISNLDARDLLRRDFKQYTLQLRWKSPETTIVAGLSTVPLKLKSWVTKGRLAPSAISWMDSRGLSVLGILTSFRDDKKFGKSGKGKHRREMLWIIRDAGAKTTDPQPSTNTEAKGVEVDELATRLWKGLEESKDLDVKENKKLDFDKDGLLKNSRVRVYKQGNANATRKVTAPLLMKILEDAPPDQPVST